MSRTHELNIERVRLDILAYAKRNNLNSDVVIAAMADIVGMSAAILDRETGAVPFDDRMAVFTERARSQYVRVTTGRRILAA